MYSTVPVLRAHVQEEGQPDDALHSLLNVIASHDASRLRMGHDLRPNSDRVSVLLGARTMSLGRTWTHAVKKAFDLGRTITPRAVGHVW